MSNYQPLNKSLTFSTIVSNNNNPTNPSYFLNSPIHKIVGYNITNFCGVNNIYTIDSRNCNISFKENSGTVYLAILPTGNYTLSTFITALGTAMTNSGGGSVYTVTNNSVTNILTITSNTLPFKILSTVNNCYYEAGFTGVLSSSYAITQIAIRTFDLSGVKQINIVSSDFGESSVCVNQNYNILSSIPISTAYLGVINFTPSDVFVNTQIQELNSINFILLDERMRRISNISDWSITLIVQVE